MTTKDSHSETLEVEGMTCNNCARTVTKRLKKLGLENVQTDFVNGEVRFFRANNIALDDIEDAIIEVGYQVPSRNKRKDGQSGLSRLEKQFIISAILTIPLFLHMFVGKDSFLNNPWLQVSLAAPVYIMGAWFFGKSSFQALKQGTTNMDVLILLGSTAAFGYSIAGMALHLGTHEMHNFLFFETAATIITLVLLGNVIEHRAVKQTTSAIRELSSLQEITAKKIIEKEGKEEISEIPAQELRVGDYILLNSGDRIPVDGKIYQGAGEIDESMLTGESYPVEKQKDDELISGTIVNSGNIRMIAMKVGQQTTLSQIVSMVKRAQEDKPKVQRLADKISEWFVPIVVGISALTFLISYFFIELSAQSALLNSIAVLVISCPCAMGLATPTAVVAGLGRAAKSGILIKGGQTVQSLAEIKTIIFDKTGTITTGKFELKDLEILDQQDEQFIKNIIYSLERNSSHPIAKSIAGTLKKEAKLLQLEDVSEIKGVGMKGSWKGETYQLGSYEDDSADKKIALKNQDKVFAILTIEDQVKKNVSDTVKYLNQTGIKTIMLSGDKKAVCEQVASQVGIQEVYAQQKPEEKLKIIEQYQSKSKVAMVGDGINDAPALAKADLGISISGASDIAMQSAQVILLDSKELHQLENAHLLAKSTIKTIRQNLFWAFFYNVIAIPIAAAGLLSPMIAALSMAFSDVIVIGNSIRLKFKKI